MFVLEGRVLAQICGYRGIAYSSPTLASAISNLTPAFTFILAIIFRFLSFLSLCFYLIFTSPYMILLFLVPNLTHIDNVAFLKICHAINFCNDIHGQFGGHLTLVQVKNSNYKIKSILIFFFLKGLKVRFNIWVNYTDIPSFGETTLATF